MVSVSASMDTMGTESTTSGVCPAGPDTSKNSHLGSEFIKSEHANGIRHEKADESVR